MVSSPPNHDARRLMSQQIAVIFVSLVVVILNSVWFIVSGIIASQLIAMLPRCTDATRARWDTTQWHMIGIEIVSTIGLMGSIILAIQIGRKVTSAAFKMMMQSLARWSFAVASVGLVFLIITRFTGLLLTDTGATALLLSTIFAGTSAAIGAGIGRQRRKGAHLENVGHSLLRIPFFGAWIILGAYWILEVLANNVLISFHCLQFHFVW